MPYKTVNMRKYRRRPYRRKRLYKKRYNKRPRLGRPPRRMMPSTYKFKRMIEQTFDLNATEGTGWDTLSADVIQKGFAASLTQLDDYAQFTALFEQYKLTGLRLQIIPSWNVIQGYRDMSQIICYVTKSRYGYTLNSIAEVLNKQAKRKFIAFTNGKPIDIYMKLNQLTQIYGSATQTDYTLKRPGWVSTQEPGTTHYGYDVILQTVSGQAMANQLMSCKILLTTYFSCRGVKATSAN